MSIQGIPSVSKQTPFFLQGESNKHGILEYHGRLQNLSLDGCFKFLGPRSWNLFLNKFSLFIKIPIIWNGCII